jgi:tape measure domain-containing protein
MSIATEIRLRIKAEGEAVLQGLGDKLNKIAANATASSQKFSVLAGELRKVEATTGRSTTLLKQYSASWRELAGAVDIASKEFKEATAEAARLDAQIAKAEGRMGKSKAGRLKTGAKVIGTAAAAGIFGGPAGAIGALGGGIAGGVEGAVVGAGIGALVNQLQQSLSALAEYTASIDRQRIALKGLTTSNSEYEVSLRTVEELSQKFQIPQEQVTRNFTKIAASVIGAGGSLTDAKIAFEGVASGVRATGGTLQDLDGALLATSQVFSKGKVSAEELRGQIGERLPGAFTLFAKSIGVTTPELDKMLKDGKVGLNDFMSFVKQLEQEYGTTNANIILSSQAAGDRLTVVFAKTQEDVGRALQPIGAAIQDGISAGLTGSQALITGFAQAVSGPLLGIAKNFDSIAVAAASFAGALALAKIGLVVYSYGGLVSILGLAAQGFAAATAATLTFTAALLANPVTAIAVGIAAAVAALTTLGVVLYQNSKAAEENNKVFQIGAVSNKKLNDETYRLKVELQDAERKLRNVAKGTRSSASDTQRFSQEVATLRGQLDRLKGIYTVKLRLEKEGFTFDEKGGAKTYKVGEYTYDAGSGKAIAGPGITPKQTNFPSGGGGNGGGDGTKGKSAAQREKERVAGVIYSQGLLAEKAKSQLEFSEKIFAAEQARDPLLVRRLQGEQQLVNFQLETLNLTGKETDLKAKLAIEQAREQGLKLIALKTDQDLAKIQLSREETGRKTLEGLQNELEIKKAVTQAERDSLRIAYEMELLKKGGTVPQGDLAGIQALKEQLAAPVLGDDLIRQQIGTLSDELLVLTDVGTQVTSVAATIGDAFSTSFKGVISGSMTAKGALASFFTSVADMFLDMAAKIIAKMITMAILNAVLGVLPGGGGSAGGGTVTGGFMNTEALKGFTPAAKGATFSNGIAKFARGGVVYDPTMFKFAQGGTMRTGLMGEAGPEAIMPLRRGRDGNLGVMSSGGGTTNVVVNVDASGSSVEGDQQQAKALGNAISAAVQSELVKQKRPGGLLSA